MTRLVLGHRRTKLRAAMAPYLALCHPAKIAAALSIREHTVRFILAGKLRPGLCCARGIARARGVTLVALLG